MKFMEIAGTYGTIYVNPQHIISFDERKVQLCITLTENRTIWAIDSRTTFMKKFEEAMK